MVSTAAEHDVYVSAIGVGEIFADPTYQRILDVVRARKMTAEWDRRLAGILEVSDRGEGTSPRYAVLDGQHRWAAARFLNNPPALVANVHTGLTLDEEAALFDKLNRQRKQITTWDHWRARRAANDETVMAIENTVAAAGLRVTDQSNAQDSVWCIGTLEKIAASAGGVELLSASLAILTAAWGHQRAAYEAPVVHGVAMVLDAFKDRIDTNRLIEALGEIPPKRIRVGASTLRDAGTPGSLAKLSALAMLNQYNQKPGKRLAWPAWWKGVLAKPRRDGSTAAARPATHAHTGGLSLCPLRRSHIPSRSPPARSPPHSHASTATPTPTPKPSNKWTANPSQ
ncbi:hypothetical protein B1R94_26105 [Mycolicibacterium litorale]|nr:hypothetical protein B1R94_26105 [Mycolicibacterium litorale]